MRIPQPKVGEPIRLIKSRNGHRYRLVVDVGFHTNGRRRQHTETVDTLTQARTRVSEIRADVKRGEYHAKDNTTFNALCDRWLDSKRDVRAVSLRGYRSSLVNARTRFGTKQAQNLTRADIEDLVTWLSVADGGPHLTRRSIAYALMTMRQVLKFGISEGVLTTNVAAEVKPPREKHNENPGATPWTSSQLNTFLQHSDMDAWAPLWRLTACGLRRSEVTGLRWPDIDFDAGTVTVRRGRVSSGGKVLTDSPKSKASHRTVPVEHIAPGTMVILKALKKRQAKQRLEAGPAWVDATESIFVNALGVPINPDQYSRMFKRLVSKAEVPPIKLHDVRHSVATLLHSTGTPAAHSAALLGHSTNVHLMTYVTPTQTGIEAAASTLGHLLTKSG